MIEERADPPAAVLSPDDSSTFGFDRPADEWFDRVRHAARRVSLGRIGDYDLLEVAGHGGQGVVYRARQGGTGREVALKRLLTGSWAGEGSRARFAREVRVDAALRHPNIVTLYAADVIDGQPLLAMEWVEGVPIDRWAAGGTALPGGAATGDDTGRKPGATDPVIAAPAPSVRPVREILRTFLRVCAGVQHAHQRGVIHRDLKPSNILVDASGEPRVLDFGLARLTGGESQVSVAASGGFVGTLVYAAPEQVRAEPDGVDVRTDVYALGGVLYQCLAGRSPFGAGRGESAGGPGGNVEALSHAICHDDPPRPSSLRPGLDRDLDAIIAKAMAKDKAERYQSVETLAADLQRHLAHEPVLARGPGAWYRTRRFARRHRALVAALGSIGLVVAGAAVMGTALYVRAERQRAIAESVYEFMHQVLTVEDPTGDLKWREVLDRAAARIDGAFPGQPLAEAEVRNMIQAMYREIGLYDRALPHAQRRRSILERELGSGDPLTLVALNDLAGLQRQSLHFEEAERLYRLLLEGRQRRFGRDHELVAEAMNNLALAIRDSDRPAEAEPLFRRAIRILERRLDPDSVVVSGAWHNLALVLDDRGHDAEAADMWRRALEVRERRDGPDHEITIGTMYNLAGTLEDSGQVEEAERLTRDALARARRTLTDGHPMTLMIRCYLGELRVRRGDAEEGESLLRAALAASREHLTVDHPSTLNAGVKLGSLLIEKGDFVESEAILLGALEPSRRTLGAAHPLTTRVCRALAKLYDAWGKPDEAEEYRAQFATEAPTPPPGAP